jgi:hypothetical protein
MVSSLNRNLCWSDGASEAELCDLAGEAVGLCFGRGAVKVAGFKKCHFQVTPEIDRALMVKGFLVLGVTLI